MPTPVSVDNGGYPVPVPDPADWQLFDDPAKESIRPRIRIQFQNYPNERKKIAQFVDSQSMSWASNWRAADRNAMSVILKAYPN